MSVIVTGCKGQLGSELLRLLPEAVGLSRQQLDIANEEAVSQILGPFEPKIIINCAAYNQVDLAEIDKEAAWAGNVTGPENLAKFARGNNCQLVHISTDFVFGETPSLNVPLTELDRAVPACVYGASKLAGEKAVLAVEPDHLAIRTCGLYGSGGKTNFVKTMLRLASQGKPLRVVNDQVCSPTSVEDLAAGVLALIDSSAKGLYHFVNEGETSWYDFARRIFEFAKVDADLSPISSEEFGAAAKRPEYSVLDCEKYHQQTGKNIRSIDEALQCYLSRNRN
jgi:dTDP-4-dehydrorhamnose reductase